MANLRKYPLKKTDPKLVANCNLGTTVRSYLPVNTLYISSYPLNLLKLLLEALEIFTVVCKDFPWIIKDHFSGVFEDPFRHFSGLQSLFI